MKKNEIEEAEAKKRGKKKKKNRRVKSQCHFLKDERKVLLLWINPPTEKNLRASLIQKVFFFRVRSFFNFSSEKIFSPCSKYGSNFFSRCGILFGII